MKRILIAVLMSVVSLSAVADRDDYRGGYSSGNSWIAPAIVGAAIIGAVVSQPVAPMYNGYSSGYGPSSMYYNASPVPMAPLPYYQWMYNPACGCNQRVLVQP